MKKKPVTYKIEITLTADEYLRFDMIAATLASMFAKSTLSNKPSFNPAEILDDGEYVVNNFHMEIGSRTSVTVKAITAVEAFFLLAKFKEAVDEEKGSDLPLHLTKKINDILDDNM
jgi:hypothetical protein